MAPSSSTFQQLLQLLSKAWSKSWLKLMEGIDQVPLQGLESCLGVFFDRIPRLREDFEESMDFARRQVCLLPCVL